MRWARWRERGRTGAWRRHAPAADPGAGEDPVHRPELPAAHPRDRAAEARLPVDLRPLPRQRRGPWAGDDPPRRKPQVRLRGRACRHHRQARPPYRRGRCLGPHRGLFVLQRRLDPRLPEPHDAVLARQEFRALRRLRPVDRDARRGGRHHRADPDHPRRRQCRAAHADQRSGHRYPRTDRIRLDRHDAETRRRDRDGQPGGVGNHRKPQLFLAPGMSVEVEITNVGTLSNSVEDETP
jgi:hypothetical protein